jgi:hypothetical protein
MKRFVFLLLTVSVLSAQVLSAQAPEVEVTAEPHHHLVFENSAVRVFDVDIPPHRESLMHWHRHDYIYVMLGPTEVSNAVQGKDPVTVKLVDGETHFIPGPFAHIARNVSDQPFHNLTIEILEDAKLHQSSMGGLIGGPTGGSAKWPEDRGLEILPGGTQEILFVKDGIRVSEFELEPNGAVPSRAGAGPLLLVAVTDLNLYTQDPRTHGGHDAASTPSHFKAGDSRWLPDGLKRPLVNGGHTAAKFVTLEFP